MEKAAYIAAAEADETALAQRVKEQGLPWLVQTIKGDTEKVRFSWGVQSLPWLTLADEKHVVRAEGFPIDELSERLRQMDGD